MLIQRSAEDLLDQLGSVIDQLQDQDFSREIPTLSGSSIGQHIRHTIEFFLCVIDGINSGVINYDKRKHDKFIQEDRKLALSVIHSIKEFLAKSEGDRPLVLCTNYSVDEADEIEIPSSLFRELAYNIEHAIHHMALIKIGVKEIAEYVQLPDHFGVASSTVRYQKERS